MTISERLSRARAAQGDDLLVLAKRIGVRKEHLHAIEDGRFGDLPPGIYGRAAIKSFAAACGFDPVEVLAACEPLLPQVEEPIAGMARVRGVRAAKPDPPLQRPAAARAAAERPVFANMPTDRPSWRLLAAAAVDACVVVTLLLVVVVCAMTALVVPVSALDHSAPAFGLMGILLGVAYFVWFGGLGGATVGQRLLRLPPCAPALSSLTIQSIGVRALRAATADAAFIRRTGAWMGALIGSHGPSIAGDDIAHAEQQASR